MPHFENVLATDASDEQIASAEPHPNIEFRVASAEASGIDANSVDLITVAQALHWFDIERFFDEVCRVLQPGGILAVWAYERCRVNPACNDVIEKIFAEVEAYWPPERDIVENHYRGVTMPLPEIAVEAFEMQVQWTADEMLSYMRTWSASQRYMQANEGDPIALNERELKGEWGRESRDVRWPLTLKICQKAT